MLATPFRLSLKKDFDFVFKKGRSYASPLFLLKWVTNSKEQSRWGFVVPNKISKKAVVRNRLKRQLRAIVHLNSARFPSGYDYVFFARPGLVSSSYEDMLLAIDSYLKKMTPKYHERT